MTKLRQSIEKKFKSKRAPLWLPYLQSIQHLGGDNFRFCYNGGEHTGPLSAITSIMIYGDYGALPAETLEQICARGVPIIIHRRNVAKPIYICSPLRADQNDTLSKQILFRAGVDKTRHISRKLLEAKFYAMRWLLPDPPVIPGDFTVAQMRQMEALHAKAYWNLFYSRLGYSTAGRRKDGQIATALNAMSKFLSGILLRWITYHQLSPFHGFLHSATDYPALVYDLIEPYRGYFDQVAFFQMCQVPDPDANQALVGMVINATKEALNEQVYTGLTRQIVTRHELFHGVVLSLKSYLDGDSRRIMIPRIDQPNGGRPRKVHFRLYGRQAGRTDFWREARRITSKARDSSSS